MRSSAMRSDRMYIPGRYAAIDIGTVTCRLLVAEVDELGGISELHREVRKIDLIDAVRSLGVTDALDYELSEYVMQFSDLMSMID